MTTPPCCPLHDVATTCGHVDTCCDDCPTLGDASYAQLLFAGIGALVLLVLFAMGIS